jgi:hypothetical protein
MVYRYTVYYCLLFLYRYTVYYYCLFYIDIQCIIIIKKVLWVNNVLLLSIYIDIQCIIIYFI